MSMRDEKNGVKVWESNRFGAIAFAEEMIGDNTKENNYLFLVLDINIFPMLIHFVEEIPKSILSCRAICREINFYSREQLQNFR